MQEKSLQKKHPLKLVVIGVGGFIGSHFLEYVYNNIPDSFLITGVDTDSQKIQAFLSKPGFNFVKQDYTCLENLEEIIEESDLVISLAALCNPAQYNTIPIEVIASNYERPRQIVEYCFKHQTRLIHFSTSEVHGRMINVADSINEEETPFLLGPLHEQRWSYACAKQLLERTIYAYGEQGLEWTIVRPFNFIGPRMDFLPGVDGEGTPRVLACFMDALLNNKELQLVDGGNNKRCFTSINDAIDALLKIVLNPTKSSKQVFNIGNPNNEVDIKDLAQLMRKFFAKKLQIPIDDVAPCKNISAREFYGPGYADSDRRMPEINKAKKILSWEPQISLEDSIQESVEWFVDHYQQNQRIKNG